MKDDIVVKLLVFWLLCGFWWLLSELNSTFCCATVLMCLRSCYVVAVWPAVSAFLFVSTGGFLFLLLGRFGDEL